MTSIADLGARGRTAAVVLAAGGGSRFEGPVHKLLAVVDGRPLIGHVLDAVVAADLDEVVVVTGAVDLSPHLPDGVTEVPNHRWAEGQATSLRAGIAAAGELGCDAVVVGLGDQPGIPASAWRAVADADSAIAVATYDGERRNPVRLAREVWPLLPTEGDRGARVLFGVRPDLVGEVPCEGQPADVDTLEDLDRWN